MFFYPYQFDNLFQRLYRYKLPCLIIWLGWCSLLLFSCNTYLVDGMRVAWSKQLFQQGNYQEALLYSLNAEQNRVLSIAESPLQLKNMKYLALRRTQYNIGLIYSALGQSKAAIKRWQFILDKGDIHQDEILQFSLFYNIGLLYSQSGQNEQARNSFVQALELRPNHEGARRALEISLYYLRQEKLKLPPISEAPVLQELLPAQPAGIDEQILDYALRQANYRFKRDAKVQNILQNDW